MCSAAEGYRENRASPPIEAVKVDRIEAPPPFVGEAGRGVIRDP